MRRKRQQRIVFTTAVLVAAIAALLFLFIPGAGRGGPRELRVLFSGETLGELEPCHCTGSMAGGLPRRGGYIEGKTGEYLLLDTGCMGNGAREFELLRARAVMRAMKVMGYDAANIGEHELWLGLEGIKELEKIGVPLVSANVLDGEGRPVASPYLLVEASDLTVAVTGLVSPETGSDLPGLQVDSPREALARLIPRLREDGDGLVVLADLGMEAVRELADLFPEISLILFRGRGDSHPPERINCTFIASVYGEARYLGDLVLTFGDTTGVKFGEGEAVLLDDRFPASDAVAMSSIGWYKDAIRGKTFDLEQRGPGWPRITPRQPEPGNGHVGSKACAKCHSGIYKKWSESRHAHAMESLAGAGYEWSPECVVCHVIGLGARDGYVSMENTPHLGQVGCEACHGPGKALLDGNCKGIARRWGEDSCRPCHTPKHHPGFIYEKHWAIIEHREAKR